MDLCPSLFSAENEGMSVRRVRDRGDKGDVVGYAVLRIPGAEIVYGKGIYH